MSDKKELKKENALKTDNKQYIEKIQTAEGDIYYFEASKFASEGEIETDAISTKNISNEDVKISLNEEDKKVSIEKNLEVIGEEINEFITDENFAVGESNKLGTMAFEIIFTFYNKKVLSPSTVGYVLQIPYSLELENELKGKYFSLKIKNNISNIGPIKGIDKYLDNQLIILVAEENAFTNDRDFSKINTPYNATTVKEIQQYNLYFNGPNLQYCIEHSDDEIYTPYLIIESEIENDFYGNRYGNAKYSKNAIAFGSNNSVQGNSALAVGENNAAIGAYSLAIGRGNKVNYADVAIGRNNIVDGIVDSAAIGLANQIIVKPENYFQGTQPTSSVAIGYGNKVNYGKSVAIGIGNETSEKKDGQIVIGKNIEKDDESDIIIGSKDKLLIKDNGINISPKDSPGYKNIFLGINNDGSYEDTIIKLSTHMSSVVINPSSIHIENVANEKIDIDGGKIDGITSVYGPKNAVNKEYVDKMNYIPLAYFPLNIYRKFNGKIFGNDEILKNVVLEADQSFNTTFPNMLFLQSDSILKYPMFRISFSIQPLVRTFINIDFEAIFFKSASGGDPSIKYQLPGGQRQGSKQGEYTEGEYIIKKYSDLLTFEPNNNISFTIFNGSGGNYSAIGLRNFKITDINYD